MNDPHAVPLPPIIVEFNQLLELYNHALGLIAHEHNLTRDEADQWVKQQVTSTNENQS